VLKPFLFVGIGGSGGKTLMTLKADLESRLRSTDYTGEWPACWQLLHIDVPTHADVAEADLPGKLPEKDYVGLVGDETLWPSVDEAFMTRASKKEESLRTVIGVRPNPELVTISPGAGAGQHRALGRMITVTGLTAIKDAVRAALAALNSPGVAAALREISRAFGVDANQQMPTPMIIVVSSLAGGSGSGAFMDICDLIRAVGTTNATNDTYAVLYAADVFGQLAEDKRRGVNANSLSAVSELLSGFWDANPDGADLSLVSTSAGVEIGAPTRRGPRYPFIVGAKNANVTFETQNDVYRAVGKALAALVVSELLQTSIPAYTQGNWNLSKEMPDSTRLKTHTEEQPLGALGFSRVGLGRDQFAEYAAQRLARGGVERILRQHLADLDESDDRNHEQIIDDKVVQAFHNFLIASGLDEVGPDNNQIIDALRPTDRDTQMEAAIDAVRGDLVAGRAQAVALRQWGTEARELLQEHLYRFIDAELTARNECSREWVGTIERRLVQLTGTSIVDHGAIVTERLLGRLEDQCGKVMTDLTDEEAKYRHWAGQLDEMVSSVLKPTNELIGPDNPLLRQAIEKGMDCFFYSAEADLRQFAVLLLSELLSNLIKPLREAVRIARDSLERKSVGDESQPSAVDLWPTGSLVPRRFEPAANEFLLEPASEYPAIFEDVVTKSAESDKPGAAETELVQHVILGTTTVQKDDHRVIRILSDWSPAVAAAAGGTSAGTRARFQIQTDPDDLLGRARDLVADSHAEIGRFVATSLSEYLDEEKVEPAELGRRVDRFHDGFSAALSTSAPLVDVDLETLQRVHQKSSLVAKPIFTEIPFARGSVGYKTVEGILQSRDLWGPEAERAFGDGRQSRVDVFSMFDSSYNPVVFRSLIGPVADEWAAKKLDTDTRKQFWLWRRSQRLGAALPVGPGVKRAMVRGWFTARLIGALRLDELDFSKMSIFDPETRAYVQFPNPGLGRTPRGSADQLVAVLESLPIALVEFASRKQKGDQVIEPYRRLRSLGTDGADGELSYEVVNAELATWIRSGLVPDGGDQPDPARSGPSDGGDEAMQARQAACLRTLATWRKSYGDLVDKPVTKVDFFRAPAVVEIGRELLTSLDELVGALQDTQSEREVDY
jgi:hypothetical protein